MMPHTVTPIRSASNPSLVSDAFEVSKQQLVVQALPADGQHAIANVPSSVRRLLKAEIRRNSRLGLGRMLVVCEATSGYKRHVLDAAIGLGIEVHLAHGSKVRHFARYKGRNAKSDAIDACMLALYGAETADLRRYQPPSQANRDLRALDARRQELKAALQAESNRLEHASHPVVLASLQASLQSLSRMLKAIETEKSNAWWLARRTWPARSPLPARCRASGQLVATTLLAHMPQLGSLTRGEAGRRGRPRPLRQRQRQDAGPPPAFRADARPCADAYMAALVAMRVCPHLRAFASRIRARGKPFKVAATAVMRKLIVIINAVLAAGQPCNYAKPA